MAGLAQPVHHLEELLRALRGAHLPAGRAGVEPLFHIAWTVPRGTSSVSPARRVRRSSPSFTLSSPSRTSKCSSCVGCEWASGLWGCGAHSASTSSSSPPLSADVVRTVTVSPSLRLKTSPACAMRPPYLNYPRPLRPSQEEAAEHADNRHRVPLRRRPHVRRSGPHKLLIGAELGRGGRRADLRDDRPLHGRARSARSPRRAPRTWSGRSRRPARRSRGRGARCRRRRARADATASPT